MRYTPVITILALALCISAAVAAEVSDLGMRKAGEDWPRFLGPGGNNQSSEKGINTDWEHHPPPIVWQRKLGSGYSMPVIARGRLFQFDRDGADARLTCLNSETGKELWQFKYASDFEDSYGYDDGPRTSPIVDDDRVYTLGPEGMLHCLRIADGSVVWKLDTSAKFGVVKNFFGVGSTPIIEGELLIANIGGSPPDSEPIHSGHVKGNGSGIVAFNKLTGAVVYSVTDELASYASPIVATIGDRRWGFVLARGGLVGFEPRTGKVDFQFPWRAQILESVNASTPVIVGDQIFISETYGPGSALLRVRPGGVDSIWQDPPGIRAKSMQCHWMTPIYHDGFLYGSSGRHSGGAELRCIELATGKVKWTQPGLARSSLLYVDGHLICLTEQGQILLLRANPAIFDQVATLTPRDGEQRLLEYPAWAAPILSHGLLYIRGKDRLLCMELIPARP